MSHRTEPRRRRTWVLCAAIASVAAPLAHGKTREATWLSAVSSTWDVASAWSTQNFPNNGTPNNTDYTVIIGAIGAPYTVTLDTNVTVNSVALGSASATLFHTAGTLTVPTLTLSAGTYQLRGGTLRNATVTGPGTFRADTAAINTLDNVTLGTNLSILPPSSGTTAYATSVRNGLDLLNNATISVGYGGLDFFGTQTLGGTGDVSFDSSGLFGIRSDGGTLTIGSGIRVRTGTGSGRLFTTAASDKIVNQGTLLADGAGHTLTITGNWSSTGTLQATNAGELLLSGTTNSLDTLRSSSGGAITLAGLDYNNVGKTLAVDSLTGNLALRTSGTGTLERVTTIHGGTITSAGSYSLQVGKGSTDSVPGATFDGVTLAGNVSVVSEGELHTTSGLTFNPGGRITLNGAAAQANMTALLSEGTQTWGGTGEIVFDGPSFYSYVAPLSGTLTVGPGVTIRTGANGGAVGSFTAGTLLVNQGTISARSGKNITVWGNWSNSGTFEADGATVHLLGDITSDRLGTLRTLNGGAMTFGGTLDNTGRTVTLSDSTGNLLIYAGATGAPSTVIGGTLTTTGSARFFLSNLTLDGVTLGGNSVVTGQATVQNNLTVNGTLLMDPAKVLQLPGTQSILGTGTIAPANTNSGPTVSGDTLTIGPSVTLRAGIPSGNANILYVNTTNTLINQGTLSADQWLGTVSITGGVENQGTIQAVNQGAIIVTSPAANRFNNSGTLRVGLNSTLWLYGAYSADRLGHIENAGSLYIYGTIDNPGTFHIDDNVGVINFAGSISGGTVAISGAGYLNPYNSPQLHAVTLDGEVVIAGASTLNVYDGLAFTPGSSISLRGGRLFVNPSAAPVGGADLSGPGEIIFNAVSSDLVGPVSYSTSPDFTIRTGTSGGAINNLANAGTILAETPGTGLYLRGTWSNSGLMKATNGGTLDLSGTWSNTGTIVVDPSSTLVLGGTVTTPGLGNIQWNGGTTLITGSLNNTGNALALTAAAGNVRLGSTTATASITGGTLTTSGGVFLDVVNSSRLDTVTLNGDVNVRTGVTLTLDNPQPSSSPAHITLNDATLSVNGTQPLAGPVEVVLNGTPAAAPAINTLNNVFAPVGSGPLVIGPGATIRTGTTGGRVSYDRAFTNRGTLSAQTAGQTLAIYRPTNEGVISATNGSTALVTSFTNATTGSMTASAGGILDLTSNSLLSSANAGSISADAATVKFAGSWSNTGTISAVNNATLNLGGTWSNAGSISATDSTLVFATMPLSLGTLSAARSTIVLAGGTLTTSQLAPFATGSNSITLTTGMTLNNAGGTLDLSDLNLKVTGATITGGTLNSSSSPLTVTSGTLIGVTVNAPVNYLPTASFASLTTTDATFTKPVTYTVPATGGPASTRLFLNGNWSNTSNLSVTNGSLVLAATGINTGTIMLDNASLTFGSFAGLGTVVRNSGTATFAGTIENAGATFDPNVTPIGAVVLGPGARVNGGTVASASPIFIPSSSRTPSVFDGVTVASDVLVSLVAVQEQSASLQTLNGLTVAGGATLTVGQFSTLRPTGSQTYAGPGTILLNGGRIDFTSADVTVGPDLTIRSGPLAPPPGAASTATISFRSSSSTGPASLVNDGTISAETPGKTFIISGPTFTNNGTLRATNGSALSLFSPAMLTNYTSATGTLTGGTYQVDDNSTLLVPYNAALPIMANAATVHISGPNASFPSLNALASNAGSLTLTNGRTFTTLGALTNAGSITLGPSAALKVAGTLANTGSVSLTGGSLLIDYAGTSPIDDLRQQLLDGRLSTSVPETAVGYFEAAQLGLTTYAGLPVDASTLLTKVTVPGDANLDGRINPDDYALLDRTAAKHMANPHWTDGDFNYDGMISSADYFLLDTSLGRQSGGVLSPMLLTQREAQFGSVYVADLVAAVPEPTGLGVSTLAALAFLGRRRRGKSV